MEKKKFIDMIGNEVNVGDVIVVPHSCDGLSQNVALVMELRYLTMAGKPRKEPELMWKSLDGRTWNRETGQYEYYFMSELGFESKSKYSTISGFAVNITKLLTPEQLNMKLLLQVT